MCSSDLAFSSHAKNGMEAGDTETQGAVSEGHEEECVCVWCVCEGERESGVRIFGVPLSRGLI